MARQFASGSFMSVLDAPITAYPFTLAAYFKPSSVASFQTVFGLWDGTQTEYGHLIGMDTNIVRCLSTDGNLNTSFAYANRTETAGSDLSIVARFTNNTTREVIVNGDIANHGVDGLSTDVPIGALNTVIIGAANDTGAPALGIIAECAIWNEVVPDWVVTALAAGFSPSRLRFNTLVRHYPLHGQGTDDVETMGHARVARTGTPDQATHPRVIRYHRPGIMLPLPAAQMGQPAAARRRFQPYGAEGVY